MSSLPPSSLWDEVQLGDMVTLRRGHDLPAARRAPGTVPVVSSSGITGFHDTPKADGPGVVTGRYGTLGQVFYVAEPFWPLNTTLYVTDFHDNDVRFVSYFLRCQDLAGSNGAAAVPGINRNVIHQIPVLRPPLAIQRKIAAILSAYDDLIENNNRRIKILEEMAQRIYREWFVDFRYPGHEGVPLVDSELGPLPVDWAVKSVDDVATVTRGRSYRSSDLLDASGRPFVNLKCIARDGGFRPDGIKRYSGDFKSAHEVSAGDIVMAVTDMTQERRIVARAARIPPMRDGPAIISMDLVCVRPKAVPPGFLLALLRYSSFADAVKEHANGANVLHLHPDRIREYRLAMPPLEVAEEYARCVDPTAALIDALHEANDYLARSRDLVLPRLVSGEIDVTGLDIAMPEAA